MPVYVAYLATLKSAASAGLLSSKLVSLLSRTTCLALYITISSHSFYFLQNPNLFAVTSDEAVGLWSSINLCPNVFAVSLIVFFHCSDSSLFRASLIVSTLLSLCRTHALMMKHGGTSRSQAEYLLLSSNASSDTVPLIEFTSKYSLDCSFCWLIIVLGISFDGCTHAGSRSRPVSA